jgi:hypothetical protein
VLIVALQGLSPFYSTVFKVENTAGRQCLAPKQCTWATVRLSRCSVSLCLTPRFFFVSRHAVGRCLTPRQGTRASLTLHVLTLFHPLLLLLKGTTGCQCLTLWQVTQASQCHSTSQWLERRHNIGV